MTSPTELVSIFSAVQGTQLKYLKEYRFGCSEKEETGRLCRENMDSAASRQKRHSHQRGLGVESLRREQAEKTSVGVSA